LQKEVNNTANITVDFLITKDLFLVPYMYLNGMISSFILKGTKSPLLKTEGFKFYEADN